jgi:peptidylprolyl isomerase domain and WD repeat-containing protein 1
MLVSRTDFLITTSTDGHLKFWKKQDIGIEFVKHYRAHLAPVIGVSASADGQLFASAAEDGSAKVFDVINFGKAPGAVIQITISLIRTTQT